MTSTIVPADKGLRRRLLVALAIVSVLAGVGLAYIIDSVHAVARLAEADPAAAWRTLRRLSWWLGIALAASGGLFLAYLTVLAARIIRSDRFPPSGMRVVRDTRLRTGRPARWIAALLMLLGVVVMVCAIAAQRILQNLMMGLASPG